MNRIFGTSSSSKKPKPTLQDVIDQVGVASLERHMLRWYSLAHILDGFPLSDYRGQDKKARWRACAIQRADEQAA
jgi:hypothetical protein